MRSRRSGSEDTFEHVGIIMEGDPRVVQGGGTFAELPTVGVVRLAGGAPLAVGCREILAEFVIALVEPAARANMRMCVRINGIPARRRLSNRRRARVHGIAVERERPNAVVGEGKRVGGRIVQLSAVKTVVQPRVTCDVHRVGEHHDQTSPLVNGHVCLTHGRARNGGTRAVGQRRGARHGGT